jgi:penicillin-binding protein 1A
MQDMLRAVIEMGSGRAVNIDSTVGGKTGSNGDKDAWMFAYRHSLEEDDHQQGYKDLVVGVWIGNDDNKPMAKVSTGGRMPARMVASFFKAERFEKNEDNKKLINSKVKAKVNGTRSSSRSPTQPAKKTSLGSYLNTLQ